MLKRIFGVLLALSLLASCSVLKKTASCDSEDVTALYTDLITKELVKTMSSREEFGDFVVSESQARSLIGLLKFELEQVRTTMSDPNSSKKSCDAKLKIVMPLNMLESAESTRQNLYDAANNDGDVHLASIYSIPVRDQLSKTQFDLEANTLSKNTSFEIQPTDDGKTLFMSSKDISDKAKSIAFVLVLNPLENKAKELKGNADVKLAQEAENELNLAKQNFELAKNENRAARDQLNTRWKMLPADVSSQLLQGQRAWVAQKKVTCGEPNSSKLTQPQSVAEYNASKEALDCDTRMTQERLNYLSY